MEIAETISLARDSGSVLYHGKPCKKCSSTIRYTLSSNCKKCDKERSQSEHSVERRKKPAAARYKKNKLAVKDYQLKRNYGISLEEYNTRKSKQDGCCAICRQQATTLCVDHCHATGRVRGLLCHPCNRGIGLLRESRQTFLAAIEYLYGPTACGASKEVPN